MRFYSMVKLILIQSNWREVEGRKFRMAPHRKMNEKCAMSSPGMCADLGLLHEFVDVGVEGNVELWRGKL